MISLRLNLANKTRARWTSVSKCRCFESQAIQDSYDEDDEEEPCFAFSPNEERINIINSQIDDNP